jgi:CRP-like cAMP-binding protein
MAGMELLKVMKHIELFRGLNDQQLLRLADISKQETYHQGQVICRQGDPGDKMFWVADGQVEIKLEDSQGGSYSVVYLGEGQVVGEMALIDRRAHFQLQWWQRKIRRLYSLFRTRNSRCCARTTRPLAM